MDISKKKFERVNKRVDKVFKRAGLDLDSDINRFIRVITYELQLRGVKITPELILTLKDEVENNINDYIERISEIEPQYKDLEDESLTTMYLRGLMNKTGKLIIDGVLEIAHPDCGDYTSTNNLIKQSIK